MTFTCTYLPELHVPVYGNRFARDCYGENLNVRKPLGVIGVNMGVDIDTWRRRIGCFSQPCKEVTVLRTLKIKHIALCIRVCLFYLLIAQGIESNPGPIPGAGSQAGNGAWRPGSTSGQRNINHPTGANRGRGGTGAGRGADRRASTVDRPVPGSDRVLRSSESSQNMMNAWLGRDRQSSGATYDFQNESRDMSSSFSGPNDGEEGEIDLKTILLDIRREVRKTNQKFDSLETEVNNLKTNHENLKSDHEELKTSHENLQRVNEALSQKVAGMSQKLDQLENQSRRENLVFHGLKDKTNESWEESESNVRKYISEDLGLDDSRISIERAHRLNTKSSPRPVIVKFSLFKDKDRVLKAYREKRANEQENNSQASGQDADTRSEPKVRVAEDFSTRVRRIRRCLHPFLKNYLKENQDAYIKFDKLVVDGTVYTYDEDTKSLVAE